MTHDSDRHSPITVTVTPTRGDFVASSMRLALRRSRFVFLIAAFWMSVPICATLSLRAAFPGQPQQGAGGYAWLAPALVFPVAIFVLVPLAAYVTAHRQWNSAAELRERREYTFSDEGIRIAGETFAAFTAWPHFVSVERLGRFVVLGTQQRLFHFIPLSAFQGEAELDRFRELVEDQVENCKL